MTAFGMAALVLSIYLWTSGRETTEDKPTEGKTPDPDKNANATERSGIDVGMFLTITLLGSAMISYILTIKADRIGRRRVIMIGSCMMVLAGVTFAISSNYWLLLCAAIVGIITPGAHEVGPFRALQVSRFSVISPRRSGRSANITQEAILAQLSPFEARTDVYAWFAVSSTLGMSAGLCIAGWITYLVRKANPDMSWKDPTPYPYVFWGYAVFGLLKVLLTFFLTEKCESSYVPTQEEVAETAEGRESAAPLLSGRRTSSYTKPAGTITTIRRRLTDPLTAEVSPANRGILIRLCILFAINSFASGLLPVTLMSWYANWRYRWFLTSRLGYAMAAVWLCASFANLFSASVARRLGLVKAMVFTHLPNAIFLFFIPLAPNWWTMLFLLLASSVLGSMDQAPRMAFVAAVFSPEERVGVMGTINVVRTFAAAGGPLVRKPLGKRVT